MALSTLLDRAIYSYSDVDRLVQLTPGTARRWLEGYRRGGYTYPPVLRTDPSGSDSVTWGEMVEARLLAEFRGMRVPLQRLRPAVEILRRELGEYPLAHARPFLDVQGRELVRRVQVETDLARALFLVVARSGQLMLSDPAQRFTRSIEFDEEGLAAFITPFNMTPAVRMDPARSFGQPTVRGVRTDVLAEDFRAGETPARIARLYELPSDEVDQALRFEMNAMAVGRVG